MMYMMQQKDTKPFNDSVTVLDGMSTIFSVMKVYIVNSLAKTTPAM